MVREGQLKQEDEHMGMFDGKSEQELREKTWEFEEFQEYFRQEGKKWGNSSQFKAVDSALKSYQKWRTKEITPESAVKIVMANDAIIKACAEYKTYKEGQAVNKGKELTPGERQRLAVMDKLSEFQTAMNLDEARDLRVVRSLAGKTWEQAGAFTITESVLTGDEKVVGANVNHRMMVEVDGRKGFFTQETKVVMDKDIYFDRLIEQADPARKALFWQNESIYRMLTSSDEATPRSIAGDSQEMKEQFMYNLKEAVDRMAPDDPRREAIALTKVYTNIAAFYAEVNRRETRPEEKEAILEEYCQGIEGRFRNQAETMRQFKDILLELPVPVPGKKLSEYQIMKAKEYIFDEKRALLQADKEILANREKNGTPDLGKAEETLQKNQERRRQLDALAADNRALHELTQITAEVTMNDLVMNKGQFFHYEDKDGRELLNPMGKTVYDKEAELTARNIATSRLAELIGLGHLVAHSEKMVVKSGDQVTSGCFMEFAKGIDPSSNDPKVMKMMSEVELKRTAGFNRDMSSMEALDFLCGQKDRHSYNLFYQLSEPDEFGKRNIIGFQGIDNDLAFGSASIDWKETLEGHNNKQRVFIGRDLAEQIRNLDDEKLEFALNDLLSQKQVDAVKERVGAFKAYIKEHMIELEDDEWDLTEYSLNTPKEQLDERGKRYVAGLQSIEDVFQTSAFGNNISHKYGSAIEVMKGMEQRRQKLENEEEKLYEGVRNIFAEPEPEPQKETQAEVKESQKETQAKAEEPQKEAQTEAKEPQKQEKKVPPAPPRRKVGFGEIERQSAQERKGPMIGNNRTVPGKTAERQQEKKAEQPQRTRMNFQSLAGKSMAEKGTAAKRSGITIGNHEKQVERKQEKGRSMR